MTSISTPPLPINDQLPLSTTTPPLVINEPQSSSSRATTRRLGIIYFAILTGFVLAFCIPWKCIRFDLACRCIYLAGDNSALAVCGKPQGSRKKKHAYAIGRLCVVWNDALSLYLSGNGSIRPGMREPNNTTTPMNHESFVTLCKVKFITGLLFIFFYVLYILLVLFRIN